ncbi:hypothetical protein INS49_009506 [Diaporthe citri]|uniref:uncharacterized protein n=1 Tax=Diaporthe citri TaxID=83186 RepID=UPI001C7F5CE4|nr:uncharacterized protein INS49_009506 [Diaporthe citri]KAG6361281.1 hypothetical protein INS49_009506 [Diaporthe citri]
MRDPGNYGGMSGDKKANRYAQMGSSIGGAYADEALEEMPWLNQSQGLNRQDYYEGDEYEQHEYREDEDELPNFQQGVSEPTSAHLQLNVSQPAAPTPQIQVSDPSPASTQPDMTEHFPEAFAHDMNQREYQHGYDPDSAEHGDLPKRMCFGSSFFDHSCEDPARPDMPGQLSPSTQE